MPKVPLPEPLPPSFGSWNRAMRGAYLKGRRAHAEGLGREACPYFDKRNASGRLTWTRAFARAWEDGFNDGARYDTSKTESPQSR